MSELKIKKLALLGVGLIGGSLVRALREKGVIGEVVGYGRGAENLQQAVELGVIDSAASSVAEAIENADLVVIAVPLGAMRDLFTEIQANFDRLADDAVVTDVGSVKGCVVDDLQAVFGKIPDWFVPGHPIAGTEKSGAAASFATLYQNRRVILTPLPETKIGAVQKITELWQIAGAEIVVMDVAHHDRVLAATSHLPHLLAFALVDVLAQQRAADEPFKYSAGGFRDFTRIASSDPTMWRDISLANQQPLLEVLQLFREGLDEMENLVREKDGEQLKAVFARAKVARDENLGNSL